MEIHENKFFRGFTAERRHAHGAAVEKFDAFDVRRANQAAVKCVGPAMILATQDVFAATAQSDRAGAMAANVAEGTKFSPIVSNDDDWFTGYIGGEKNLLVGDGAPHPLLFSPGVAERSHQVPTGPGKAGLLQFQSCPIKCKTPSQPCRATH